MNQAQIIAMSAALMLALVSIADPAYAAGDEPWRPAARQCAEDINREVCPQYGNCEAMWPAWVRCTIQEVWGQKVVEANSERLEACIKRIWDYRWRKKIGGGDGDPVAETLACTFPR